MIEETFKAMSVRIRAMKQEMIPLIGERVERILKHSKSLGIPWFGCWVCEDARMLDLRVVDGHLRFWDTKTGCWISADELTVDALFSVLRQSDKIALSLDDPE